VTEIELDGEEDGMGEVVSLVDSDLQAMRRHLRAVHDAMTTLCSPEARRYLAAVQTIAGGGGEAHTISSALDAAQRATADIESLLGNAAERTTLSI